MLIYVIILCIYYLGIRAKNELKQYKSMNLKDAQDALDVFSLKCRNVLTF